MLFTAHYAARSEYIVKGRQETLQRPFIRFWVHPLNLTADDKHSMQLNSKHIPSPTVNGRLSSTFLLPVGVDIAYGVYRCWLSRHSDIPPLSFCQILENEKLLLVIINQDNVFIHLDRFPAMERAVRGKPIKHLNREKLGEDVLFAFDETKRVLVVCASVKVHQIVRFDKASLNVLFIFSYNFTYSFSTRRSKRFRDRVVPLISHHGMVSRGSPFYTWPSYAGTKRWC